MDRKLLEAVIHRFDGGPVGLDNIAASIGRGSPDPPGRARSPVVLANGIEGVQCAHLGGAGDDLVRNPLRKGAGLPGNCASMNSQP